MPRPSQSHLDPEFWERLRETLRTHMRVMGLKQNQLAPRLGLDPTTLNNFLNRQSNSLNGLAVALACTFVNLACGTAVIGRITSSARPESVPEGAEDQLVLEFEECFEFQRKSERPTLVLRRSPGGQKVLRLSVTKVS
jgi:hypothetical protein